MPLNVTIRKVLKEYLESHHPGGEWLFLNRYGERLSERSAERMVRKYARLAGLDRVTVHTLRHTFCKMLVDAGESLDRVAALAGHSSLNTTARHTKLSFTDLGRAMAWEWPVLLVAFRRALDREIQNGVFWTRRIPRE